MFCRVISFAALVAVVVADGHWNYEHQDYWKQINLQCAGKRQSPINVMSICTSPNVTMLDENLWIEPTGYANAISPEHFELANNGHSAQLTLKLSDAVNSWAPKVKGSGVENNEYQFNQLHFHWNEHDDDKGSEHALDGRRYALEMHLVHFNTKYTDMFHAGDKSDGLVVLAVMFDVEERDNPAFDVITDQLPKVEFFKDKTNLTAPLQLSKLLPRNFETFYKYTGSLTTPPCSEAVIWIIFPDVLKIGRNQLQRFRDLDSEAITKLSVVRNLQALGDRKIFISSDQHCPEEIQRQKFQEAQRTANSVVQSSSPGHKVTQPLTSPLPPRAQGGAEHNAQPSRPLDSQSTIERPTQSLLSLLFPFTSSFLTRSQSAESAPSLLSLSNWLKFF